MSQETLLVLASTVVLSAFLQGLSGLGFSLLAAPVITQVIPGSSSVGLVNLLALSQNSFMLWRDTGKVNWKLLRLMLPGLLVGVLIGFALVVWIPPDLRPLVVAASSLASLAALLYWRPEPGRFGASTASIWGGSVNTYSGVGGPPLAAYLVRQGMEHGDYIRTQQLVFLGLNLVSLPILGLPSVEFPWLLAGLALVAVGSSMGMLARRFISEQMSKRITEVVIAAVALAALARALLTLLD